MTGNWNLEEGRLKPLTAEYFSLYSQVGADRFDRAVTRIIHEGTCHYFPAIAEFKPFIPEPEQRQPFCENCVEGFVRVPDYEARRIYGDPDATRMRMCECRQSSAVGRNALSDEEWSALVKDRSAHPENYFGMADVQFVWGLLLDRKKRGLPRLPFPEILEAIYEARKNYGVEA